MTISYLYTGEPMVGTANDDFVIAYKGSTGTDNNTVNGNNGDDLVIGDSGDTWIPNASYLNGSIAAAFNFETLTSTWTTAENEMFGDWTIPHTTAMVETTIGQSEFFRIAIGAGQQIVIDLDFASNTAIGTTRDLVVELQDSLGNIIATADDSLVTQGGQGSFASSPGSASSYDPYLTYTVPTGGIYYINVRPFGGGPGSTFTENNTFVLNVSVGGHAVAAANPVQGADALNGGEGNDALFGQGGGDTINGDGGDDFIDSGSGADIVKGGEGNDTLYGGDGTEENIHGDNGNDRLFSGGEGHYYGDAGNDIVYAGLTAGVNEVLDGGADIDTIDTTTWNGSYTISLLTGVTNFGEFFTNFENVVSGNGADTITGTDGANVITTQGGIDTVNAGAGNDVVAGGADGDTLDGGADSDIVSYRTSNGAVTVNLIVNTVSGGHAAGDLISNFEGAWGSVLGDTLTADTGNNELRGFEGNDVLSGGGGNDILDGGLNDDTMTGGIGNDTYYVDSLGDTVNELAGQGTDTLALGFSYVLANGSALEWLATIDPLATNVINLTGNSGANRITGNAGANVLNGAGGVDVLIGLGGDDFYFVDNVGDVVAEGAGGGTGDRVFANVSYTLGAGVAVELLTTSSNGGTSAINLTGNELANTLVGNAGANVLTGLGGDDTLVGGTGADTMVGGTGDDRFIVDNAGDTVTELNGQGTDTVESSVSFSLAGQYLENLTLTGSGTIDATGNSLANTLVGNAGANVLDGAAGGDTMRGGTGDDRYIVDNAGDTVTELNGQGTDTVESGVSFDLAGQFLENLTLTGSGAINATGNGLVNTLVGNAGANVLDGKDGGDTMRGAAGDDRYVVDNAGDTVTELNGQGTDTVESSVSFDLAGQYLENLTLTGSGAITATGNSLVNTLVGNAGANVLDGKGGADTMRGAAGNDRYIVDNAGDTVTELNNQGTDTVESSVSFDLAGQYLENLTLTGSGAITATGNGLVNTLVGNAGANVLDGKGGADTMRGAAGDDRYVVDNASDTVTELNNQGTDTVESSVSFDLAGQYLENLTLTGSGAITATGNSLVNTLVGNAGANVLDGKGGGDALSGLAGADTFAFTTALGGGNVDAIVDFSVADDTIRLENAVFAGLAAGALAAGAFNTGAAATQADDRVIYNSATGALLFDADGLGGAAGVQFATISAGLALTSADFLVI